MKNINTFLCFATVLFGCSTGLQIQEIPKTANVVQELQLTDTAINEAAVKQVNILSPRNFMDAKVSLDKAKEAMDKQKEAKDVLHQIAVARAFLKRANEVANQAQISMGEVVVARQKAIAAGAAQFYPIEFNKADSKLKDVTADIEADELDSAKADRGSLEKSYRDLEFQGIMKEKLSATESKQDKNAFVEQTVTESAAVESVRPEYSDKEEFIVKAQQDLDLMKKDLAELKLQAKHAKLNAQKKTQRKIQSAKKDLDRLYVEIDELKKSSASEWGKVKSKFNNSMSSIQKSIKDSRKWMSEKIAP